MLTDQMRDPDSRPLRILIGANVKPDPDAGASGTVFQMNQALRRLGHDVDEIWQPELGRRIQHGNLHYLLELPYAYRSAMRRRLANRTYDVLEFNQPHAYLAAADFRRNRHEGVFVNRSHGHEIRSEEALAPWQREFRSPGRRGPREWISRALRPLLHRHWSQITRAADGFHVSCNEDATYLIERFRVPCQQIAVISQGIPDSFIRTPRAAMTDQRRRRLLYVGQLAFFKAPMIVARIVTSLLEARPDLTMTWVCSQSHHSEVRSLLSPVVQSRVTLSDWRPQRDLVQIYDEHGIFLFPSFFEGFGKAPLEAMSRGMCVVASETGGMRDFIEHGRTGCLLPVGRADLFADCVSFLLDRPAACEAMSLAARDAACHHTWDACAISLTEFYRQLLVNARKQIPAVTAVVPSLLTHV